MRVLTELVGELCRCFSSGFPSSARKESLLSTVIDVGGIKVSALNDGVVYLPPMYYPGLDFGAHPELLQADGTYRIPVGCFLIQAEDLTVLVDAGLGPSSIPFPGDIAVAAGLTDPPEVIAAGGCSPRRAGCRRCRAGGYQHRIPYSSARRSYRVGRPWWCSVLSRCGGHVQRRRVADAASRPAARRAGGQDGACGRRGCGGASSDRRCNRRARAWYQRTSQPGRTPGHYVVSVSSNGESAYLLGDAVHHPLQLNDKGISFLSETEPERALRAREALLTALQGRNVSIGMTQFPGLDFQRITTADGREWTTAG